jgi:hypothetical protein
MSCDTNSRAANARVYHAKAMSRSENSGMSDYHALPWQVTNERTFKRKWLDLKCSYCYNIGHLIDRCWQLYPEIKPRFAEQWGCRTLTAEHGVAATLDWFRGFFCFFVNKGVDSLESPPSILVTRNPNWSFRDSKARDWLRKGQVLASLVRST